MSGTIVSPGSVIARQMPINTVNEAHNSLVVSDKMVASRTLGVALVPQLCSNSNHTIILATQVTVWVHTRKEGMRTWFVWAACWKLWEILRFGKEWWKQNPQNLICITGEIKLRCAMKVYCNFSLRGCAFYSSVTQCLSLWTVSLNFEIKCNCPKIKSGIKGIKPKMWS